METLMEEEKPEGMERYQFENQKKSKAITPDGSLGMSILLQDK